MSATPTLLGLYRPGTTALHRMSPGAKLLCLFVISIAITVVRGPESALVSLSLALVLVIWARMSLRVLLRALRPIIIVTVLLGAFQVWQRGWPVAIEVVADLFALVIVASAMTATTPIDAMLDTIARAFGPLRRFGANPERIALAMALMLRSVPGLLEIASETRDAAKARGLERNPRALLVPMALRTVARAQATGDALAARGIGDD